MTRTFVLVLACLGACAASPPKLQLMSAERKQFVRHMGHVQKLAFDLQSETAEPIDQKKVDSILDQILGHFAAARRVPVMPTDKYARGLDGMFDQTEGRIRAVRERPWTRENARDYFGVVTDSCRACHDRFAP